MTTRSIVVFLLLFVPVLAEAACPPKYTDAITTTGQACNEGELCEITNAPFSTDSSESGFREVSGQMGSSATVKCPAGYQQIELNESEVMTNVATASVSRGSIQRYCFISPRPTTRVVIQATVGSCRRWRMIARPPEGSGMPTLSSSGMDPSLFTARWVGSQTNHAGLTTFPAGAYTVDILGFNPGTCGSSTTYTLSQQANFVGLAGSTPPKPENTSEMCFDPNEDFNSIVVRTFDRSADGCGTVNLQVTESSSGLVSSVNNTGTNEATLTFNNNAPGHVIVRVQPGAGPAPSTTTPCNGKRPYRLIWRTDEIKTENQATPGPPVVTPSPAPTAKPTPRPNIDRTCPVGYRQISGTYCPSLTSQCWDGGLTDTISPEEILRYCIHIRSGTVDDGGIDRRNTQHPVGTYVSNLKIRMSGESPSGTLVGARIVPPVVSGLPEVDVSETKNFTRNLGSEFAPISVDFVTLVELYGGSSGEDQPFLLQWNATNTVLGPTPTPVGDPGPTPTPILVPIPWNTPAEPIGIDPVIGLRPAIGANVGAGFNASGITTFQSVTDYIFLAPYYYHWDPNERTQTSDMSMFPAEYPLLKDYGWRSSLWHQKNIRDMSAAGVNVMALVYEGFPVTGGTFNQNYWANGAIPGIIAALDALKGHMKVPKIALWIPIDDYIDDYRNPLARRIELHKNGDLRYLNGVIRDFWSQIPSEHWAQIDHQPIIIFGRQAQTTIVNDLPGPWPTADKVHKIINTFKTYFGGKTPLMLVDGAVWGYWDNIAPPPGPGHFEYIYTAMPGSTGGGRAQVLRNFDNVGDDFFVTYAHVGWDASRWSGEGRTVPPSVQNFDIGFEPGVVNELPNPWAVFFPDAEADDTKNLMWILGSWNHFYAGNVTGASQELGTGVINSMASWVKLFTDGLDNSTFVSQTLPTFGENQMNVGATGTAVITFLNSGTTSWSDAADYYLGSQHPQDNGTWGLTRFDMGTTVVPPGGVASFNLPITAPTTVGTYNFQWQMLREGDAWFGEKSTNVAVSVVTATPSPVATATPTPTPIPSITAVPATPSPTPSPTPTIGLPPTPGPKGDCPEGFTTLQPPFGVPGVCYEQGVPDRPIKVPDSGQCPEGYYVDTTSPWGDYCRPLSTPIPAPATPAPTTVNVGPGIP